MADDKTDDQDVELATSKSGISVKTIILIVIIFIVLLSVSIGATVFFLSGSSDKGSSNDSEHAEETTGTDGEQGEVVSKPAIYFLLKPDFVINFESDGKANFLSVQIEVMAREEGAINIIQKHMPLLRNNILLLLSSQKYDVVRTLEGKNKLREDILKIMEVIINDENTKLKKEKDEDFHEIANIEAIYFTGFIMQ